MNVAPKHVHTSGAATKYRYDGQMPVEEMVGSGGTTTRFGNGARGMDYMLAGTAVSFPIYDGHGNMVGTTARNGTSYSLGNQRKYDVWGTVRSGSGTGDPKQRHCANLGHIQDDDTGLIYMRARYYEATTGRFVSRDQGLDGSNWYVYCGSDPVNYVDASGKWKIPGGYKLYLDFDIAGGIGDLHAFKDGKEILSVFADGAGHHIKAVEWPKDLVKAIVMSAAQGDVRSINVLNGMKEGLFGFDPEVLNQMSSKGSGMAFMAYTTIDAAIQNDPVDVIDTLKTAFGG